MAWYFQVSPHDTHDWDATQTPVLFDAVVNGQRRKLLAQASRNGMFFLLDRVTGEKVLSTQYLPSANWSLGFKPPGAHSKPCHGASGLGRSCHLTMGRNERAPPSYSADRTLVFHTVEGYVVHYRSPLDMCRTLRWRVEQAVGCHAPHCCHDRDGQEPGRTSIPPRNARPPSVGLRRLADDGRSVLFAVDPRPVMRWMPARKNPVALRWSSR